ncbi:MAG: hypothetical protein V7K86_01925 [Nostoc sp.]
MRGQNNLLRSLAIALEHSLSSIPYQERPGNVTRYCQIFIGHWGLGIPSLRDATRTASLRDATRSKIHGGVRSGQVGIGHPFSTRRYA